MAKINCFCFLLSEALNCKPGLSLSLSFFFNLESSPLISSYEIFSPSPFLSLGKYTQISEGQQFNAFFKKWPVVGENFIFYYFINSVFYLVDAITTTTVLEIIDEKTFRTKNSVYTIYTIEHFQIF